MNETKYARRKQCRFCPAVTTSVYGACWRHPLRHCIYCGTPTVHPHQVCAEHEDLVEAEAEVALESLTDALDGRITEMSDDMQITIFGDEVPTDEVPHLNCTRTAECQAPADAHEDDCPVEHSLLREFGF